MKLIWLGTGSGLNFKLGNTSFLVKGDQNRNLLVDCGYTVTSELLKRGELASITDILITHSHSDHVGGLEGLGFMNYFGLKKREEQNPNLYLGSEGFKQMLWNNCLKGSMQKIQNFNGLALDASLDTYFNSVVSSKINIPGIPEIKFVPTMHVQGMESYAIDFANGIYYSGDTIELPPENKKILFQDCQCFYSGPGDVHISYDKLLREMSDEHRAKTYLVHLSGNWETKNPKADGFAGFVLPGQEFEF